MFLIGLVHQPGEVFIYFKENRAQTSRLTHSERSDASEYRLAGNSDPAAHSDDPYISAKPSCSKVLKKKQMSGPNKGRKTCA